MIPLGILNLTAPSSSPVGISADADEVVLLLGRDGVVYVLNNLGELSIASSQAPLRLCYAVISENTLETITQTGVPIKVNGVWEIDPLSVWFIVNEDNAVELTDPEAASNTEIIQIVGSAGILGGGASGYDLMIYVNGQQVGNSVHLDLTTNSASFSLASPAVLTEGDTIELWIARTIGNDNVVVVDATMIIR